MSQQQKEYVDLQKQHELRNVQGQQQAQIDPNQGPQQDQQRVIAAQPVQQHHQEYLILAKRVFADEPDKVSTREMDNGLTSDTVPVRVYSAMTKDQLWGEVENAFKLDKSRFDVVDVSIIWNDHEGNKFGKTDLDEMEPARFWHVMVILLSRNSQDRLLVSLL